VAKEHFNQGDFWMCWVAASVGSVESAYAIKNPTKDWISLSRQEIVNCFHQKYPLKPIKNKKGELEDHTPDIKGFYGGRMYDCLKYIKEYGIALQADTPWVDKKEDCNISKGTKRMYIDGYKTVKPKQDKRPEADKRPEEDKRLKEERLAEFHEQMRQDINKQPLAASMVACSRLKKLTKDEIYKVYPKGLEDSPKHSVLVVGHGIDSSTQQPYYIIKNSWRPDWCDGSGFGKISPEVINYYCYPRSPRIMTEDERTARNERRVSQENSRSQKKQKLGEGVGGTGEEVDKEEESGELESEWGECLLRQDMEALIQAKMLDRAEVPEVLECLLGQDMEALIQKQLALVS
jgi:hypothetical protein